MFPPLVQHLAPLAQALPIPPELGSIVPSQSAAWHDRFSIDLVEAIGVGPTLHPDPLQQGLPQERGIDRPVSMAVSIRCVSRRVRRVMVVGLVFTHLSMLRRLSAPPLGIFRNVSHRFCHRLQGRPAVLTGSR